MQEAEKRLRDIVTGKKPSGALAVNGTAARKMGGKQRQQLFVFTVHPPLWSNRLMSVLLSPLTFVSVSGFGGHGIVRGFIALMSEGQPSLHCLSLVLAGKDLSWG